MTLLALLLVLACAGASAATIHVPADHPTVQAALDAAVPGDLVLLAPGTYRGAANRDLDTRGKAITLAARDGSGTAILDAEGAGRGFHIHSGEGEGTVLRDLVIQNGYTAATGGGILCRGSSPTIQGCLVRECAALYHGGGIDCYEAGPRIAGCRIEDCAAGTFGGGICSYLDPAPLLEACRIRGNSAGLGGGGYFGWAAAAELLGCSLEENRSRFGGGAYLQSSHGAAVMNCLLQANHGERAGGGIFLERSSVALGSCTLRGNAAGEAGGALSCRGTTLVVSRSILWEDAAAAGTEIALGDPDAPSQLVIDTTDLAGGAAAVLVGPGSGLTWGAGMLEADPLFLAGEGWKVYLSQKAAGQDQDSPCLDAGGEPAATICLPAPAGTVCLDELTTRTDQTPDDGMVDLGVHRVPAPHGPSGAPPILEEDP